MTWTGPFLGVVADDLTGACDLADAVVEAGCTAAVLVGPPATGEPPLAADVVVVALKTRTAPVDEAVAESTASAEWLLAQRAQRLYQKYCSTFDSTPEGTIGPVADALLDLLASHAGSRAAVGVGTPATPRSGRTQYRGHLFVGDRLLSESPLRDHPLTPMRDPDLVRVLGPQTSSTIRLVPWDVVAEGVPALATALRARIAGPRTLVLADALRDADLDTLAAAVDALAGDAPVLLSGAAGFAAALARRRAEHPGGTRRTRPVPPGGCLILSGSCSAATLAQVAAFAGPRFELDPLELLDDRGGVLNRLLDAVAAELARDPDRPVLVSSSAPPGRVRQVQQRAGGSPAALLEEATGWLAAAAVDSLGVRRLLVAGGETSGAVARAVGARRLAVGPPAAPGVPWMVTDEGEPLALLLKSGNFGRSDLFTAAWGACP